MDNIGLPVHGAETETTLFGSLPTVWLQGHVYSLWPSVSSWSVAVIHVSWFVVPWLAALLVSWKRPRRIGSFFGYWIALHFIANAAFALYPLRPPWMADSEVTRLLATHLGSMSRDTNLLAAMPSLHVALPFLISLWFFRERWRTPALVMVAYTAVVAFEVVLSGEHYVVDVIGAVVVAGGVAVAAGLKYRRISSWLSTLWRAVIGGGRGRLEPALSQVRASRPESGQALIELAFVLPLIFVFLLVIVDFGIALDRRQVIQHGVREGTRAAAVGAPIDDPGDGADCKRADGQEVKGIKCRTVVQSEGVLSKDDVTVCYVDGPDGGLSPGNAGDSVRVSATYTYRFSVGSGELLTAFGASVPSIEMTPEAEARLEGSVTGAAAC